MCSAAVHSQTIVAVRRHLDEPVVLEHDVGDAGTPWFVCVENQRVAALVAGVLSGE